MASYYQRTGGKMSWKRKLRACVFCFGLAWASALGAAMRPEEIEELLAAMHQTRLEYTIPQGEDTCDDFLRNLFREKKENGTIGSKRKPSDATF
jgi:hypothetical protein